MFVAEYSKSQNAYHIGEENDLLHKDIEAFTQRGWIGDYEVIGRFKTHKEASEFIKQRKNNV